MASSAMELQLGYSCPCQKHSNKCKISIHDHMHALYSCSLFTVRKIRTVWDSVLHAAVMRTLCIVHLLASSIKLRTPVPKIKLRAFASYHLFHSHAQIIISYWLDKVNSSIVCPVMSCHVMSCHVMSCHVMLCHVAFHACLSSCSDSLQ